MIAHDPELVRWGLHTLCLPSTTRRSDVIQHEDASETIGYVREQYVGGEEGAVCSRMNYLESDAVIARALQEEEYSRISPGEASGGNYGVNAGISRSNAKDEEKKLKVENADDLSFSREEEDLLSLWDTAEESARDGKVGEKLNEKMVPVPHAPKINGQIPSEAEEVSDHQRLLERLKVYELVENKIQGDGNCQFRAISDQLYRSSDHHMFVREQVVQQLKSLPEAYEGYVPMSYSDYVKKMSKSGEWGDHVTLQATADSYGVKIFVITSFKDTCYIEILPRLKKSSRVICLSFWAEVHYNSIYPEGEVPPPEARKHKKWWARLTG